MNKSITLIILIFSFNLLISQNQALINNVVPNSTEIGRYSKLELSVDLTATYTNPYDFSQINLLSVFTSPSGVKDTVDGFYYQNYIITDQINGTIEIDGSPEWKVRFSPTEIGQWQYDVFCTDVNGTSNIVTQNFDCITSNSKGYIRVANNMFMKYDDGSQFFGIGENMCWATYQDQNQIIKDYRVWMDSLNANKGNLIRLWMAQWSFALEWNDTGLKDYTNRQDNAFYLDWVVNFAEEKDIYIELCLNYHGQFSLQSDVKWPENPYNADNGGPCATNFDFFTNSTAKEIYKNKLRYINARWGYSTSIFSWEAFNEVDMIDWTDYHETEVTAWTDEMSQYIRNIDVNNHLLSTSCGVDYNYLSTWELPIIDYTQTHYYKETDEIETIMVDGNQNFLDRFQKPTKNGEFGLYVDTNINSLPTKDPNAIHIHNAIWSTALSGSFSTAMSWWWAPEHYLHNENIQAYRHYKELSNFMSVIDLLSTTYSSQNFNCLQNNSNFYTVIPEYGWGQVPENNFIVIGPVGVANTNELGQFLYSLSSGSNLLNNPPTFNVNYQNNGTFTVYTDISIGTGAIIEVYLDGNLALHENAYVNSKYTISVPAGNHTIKVESVGADWIKVAKYIFDDNIQIKSNGLVSSNSAYGWVHNKNYNWNYVYLNGEPTSISDSKILVKNLYDADYDVSFYNTSTGELINQSIYTSVNDSLVIDIPELLWDFSFKIEETTSTSSNKLIKTNDIKIYPNPAKNSVIVQIPTNNYYNEINIIDVLGQKLVEQTIDINENSIYLNTSKLKCGVYFIVLKSPDKNITKQLIINK